MSVKNTARKGGELQRLAKACLEAQGWLVETAPNVVRWIRIPGMAAQPDRKLRPISTRHDFFGVWDGVMVQGTQRYFFQVTVLDNVSDRRRKILASGFPCASGDMILGYKGGRDRHFRVYPGPDFAEWRGGCFRPVNVSRGSPPVGAILRGSDE